MSFFVQATPAPRPRNRNAKVVALYYAALLVVFAVAQLFSFENFLPLLESFWLPGGRVTAYIVGTVLVVSEVLALPFLLRMSVSPAARAISMVLGWIVPAIWLFLTLWLNLMVNAIANVGFLGTNIPLPVGWWAVCVSLAMGTLAVWASWGLWPIGRK